MIPVSKLLPSFAAEHCWTLKKKVLLLKKIYEN